MGSEAQVLIDDRSGCNDRLGIPAVLNGDRSFNDHIPFKLHITLDGECVAFNQRRDPSGKSLSSRSSIFP